MDLYQALSHALILVFQLSMPVIIAATAVGLTIGLIQALTQIQDQTLPHAVKLIAVGAVIMIMGGALATRLVVFATDIFSRIGAG
ncbi:type III secretion system export apparatus subunit SctS [Paracoccus sp. (in: a-proteobacteria)]|uniref:type III secretion system export apparatus subunit SctS n=1 Tax=Paracoccus sp. TaxID=267 RepID=UPI003A8AADB9